MADQMAALTIVNETTPDGTVVHCSGRLISTTADELKLKVQPLIVGGRSVLLDLSDVTFMD